MTYWDDEFNFHKIGDIFCDSCWSLDNSTPRHYTFTVGCSGVIHSFHTHEYGEEDLMCYDSFLCDVCQQSS